MLTDSTAKCSSPFSIKAVRVEHTFEKMLAHLLVKLILNWSIALGQLAWPMPGYGPHHRASSHLQGPVADIASEHICPLLECLPEFVADDQALLYAVCKNQDSSNASVVRVNISSCMYEPVLDCNAQSWNTSNPYRLALTSTVLYVTGGNNTVYAVDTRTLELLWSVAPVYSFEADIVGQLTVHEEAGILVFSASTTHAPDIRNTPLTVVALDAREGQLLWTYSYITGNPRNAQVPVTISEDGSIVYFLKRYWFDGASMIAMNASTGVLIWSAYLDYVPSDAGAFGFSPILAHGVHGASAGQSTVLLQTFAENRYVVWVVDLTADANLTNPPAWDIVGADSCLGGYPDPSSVSQPLSSPALWYSPTGTYARYFSSGLCPTDIAVMTLPGTKNATSSWPWYNGAGGPMGKGPVLGDRWVSGLAVFVDVAGVSYSGSSHSYQNLGATSFSNAGEALRSQPGQVGYCAVCANRTLCCISTLDSNLTYFQRLVIYTEHAVPTPPALPSRVPSSSDAIIMASVGGGLAGAALFGLATWILRNRFGKPADTDYLLAEHA